MITPSELLDFALELTLEGTRPEAYARRAVSAAYYALFHTLSQAGAALFQASPDLQQRLARSFEHGAFGKCARSLDAQSKSRTIDSRLVNVARTFTRLQELREKADYDLTANVGWQDAEEAMFAATNACDDFRQVFDSDDAKAFVLDPLLRARRG